MQQEIKVDYHRLRPTYRVPRFATLRTVGALILRELGTTNGRRPGGYLWKIIEPIGGIFAMTLLFSLFLKAPPLGTSFAFFYATGMIPFLIFMKINKALSAALSYSKQLLVYPRVTIGEDCRIGDRVTLHPGVVIGDRVEIGDGSEIFPNVTIYDRTVIGRSCRIHSGTVVGSDGFSFTPDENGHQFKLLQIGRVVIEDEVEIGANCCIDRAGFGETRLRRGSRFDNLIQIGHNVEIGEDTVVAALAGFSGGTRVGRNCIIAGQIGTNQHITIGDRVIVTARTGVTKSVEPGRVVGGMMPAMDYQHWRRAQVLYGRLPELFERLRKLEKKS